MVVFGITRIGEHVSRLLPEYFVSVMSMELNVSPSLLFCHCSSSGTGNDIISENMRLLHPDKTTFWVVISAHGKSIKKKKVHKLDQIETILKTEHTSVVQMETNIKYQSL